MQSDESIPDLTVERRVDPKTGEPIIRYFWKRKRMLQVSVSGKIIDTLAGYSLIEKDLNNALEWTRQARRLVESTGELEAAEGVTKSTDRETFNKVKSLFVSALTFYGKSFTQAQGRGPTLNKKDILAGSYLPAHEFYMGYRHNFAAHSGDAKLEYNKTYVLLHPNRKSHIEPFIVTNRIQPDVVLDHDDYSLEELIDHVRRNVHVKYEKLSRKVHENHVDKNGKEFWRNAAKKRKSVKLSSAKKKRG